MTEAARLRQLVWFDIATAATAVAVMALTYVAVVRSGWLLVLAGLVGASGATMAIGLRPLRDGDLSRAVAWLGAANWVVALTSAAIATFAWPLMVLAALLPAVFAAPYVSAARLRAFVAVSLAVSMGVAVVGLLQDFSAFTDQLPEWVPPTILIFFAPFLAGMVLTTAVQHGRRLQDALARTQDANRSLQASRARLVTATDRERRRVERDLHDGAQQRLVAIGIRLTAAQEMARSRPGEVSEELASIRAEVGAAHRELRDLAQGVYPPVLTQHGLANALDAVADRCRFPVSVRVEPGRFSTDAEATAYFCCVEALQNVGKHAGPGVRATVEVTAADGVLEFAVADDGCGFDPDRVGGTGLDNLRDRVGAGGGELSISSSSHGTTVRGRIPW